MNNNNNTVTKKERTPKQIDAWNKCLDARRKAREERVRLKKLELVVMVYLVRWPESQKIMTHPEAQNVENSSSYIVPIDVWEKYKNNYHD